MIQATFETIQNLLAGYTWVVNNKGILLFQHVNRWVHLPVTLFSVIIFHFSIRTRYAIQFCLLSVSVNNVHYNLHNPIGTWLKNTDPRYLIRSEEIQKCKPQWFVRFVVKSRKKLWYFHLTKWICYVPCFKQNTKHKCDFHKIKTSSWNEVI